MSATDEKPGRQRTDNMAVRPHRKGYGVIGSMRLHHREPRIRSAVAGGPGTGWCAPRLKTVAGDCRSLRMTRLPPRASEVTLRNGDADADGPDAPCRSVLSYGMYI